MKHKPSIFISIAVIAYFLLQQVAWAAPLPCNSHVLRPLAMAERIDQNLFPELSDSAMTGRLRALATNLSIDSIEQLRVIASTESKFGIIAAGMLAGISEDSLDYIDSNGNSESAFIFDAAFKTEARKALGSKEITLNLKKILQEDIFRSDILTGEVKANAEMSLLKLAVLDGNTHAVSAFFEIAESGIANSRMATEKLVYIYSNGRGGTNIAVLEHLQSEKLIPYLDSIFSEDPKKTSSLLQTLAESGNTNILRLLGQACTKKTEAGIEATAILARVATNDNKYVSIEEPVRLKAVEMLTSDTTIEALGSLAEESNADAPVEALGMLAASGNELSASILAEVGAKRTLHVTFHDSIAERIKAAASDDQISRNDLALLKRVADSDSKGFIERGKKTQAMRAVATRCRQTKSVLLAKWLLSGMAEYLSSKKGISLDIAYMLEGNDYSAILKSISSNSTILEQAPELCFYANGLLPCEEMDLESLRPMAISLLTSKKDLGEERVDEFLPAGEAAWASEMVKIYYLSIWSVLSKALQDDGVVMPQKKIEEIINTIMNYASLVNKSFSGADASTFMVARDTLLEDFKNPAQLIAVFAHELGHRIDDIISDYINENEQDFAREDYSELFADLCAYYFLEKMGWESEISPMLATWAKQYENYSNVFPEPESKTIGLAEEEHKSARAFLDQIAEFLLGKGFRERTITQADALKLQKTFFTFLNFGITGKTEHANQIEFIALSQALAKFLRPVNEETADEEVIEVGTKVVATLDASPRRLVIVPRANLLIKLQSEEMQSQI